MLPGIGSFESSEVQFLDLIDRRLYSVLGILCMLGDPRCSGLYAEYGVQSQRMQKMYCRFVAFTVVCAAPVRSTE